MKILSTAVIALAAAQKDEKKVPPRHPIQRLNRLVEFTGEIMNDWFGFLPSQQAWINKFANNAKRMEKNFKRCGFYNENVPNGGPKPDPSSDRKRREADEIDVDRYNRENPTIGIQQLTTGFSKWAERYLAACSGQRNYNFQVNRMAKWNNILQSSLSP